MVVLYITYLYNLFMWAIYVTYFNNISLFIE
jgi:hypothetical protein